MSGRKRAAVAVGARDDLEVVDFVIAFAVGLLALLGFVALSMVRGKELATATLGDENATYVKVDIAPVSEAAALKGNKTAPIPNAWQRKTPPPEALKPPTDTTQAPLPNAISSSTAAPTDTAKHPPPDAAAPLVDTDDASAPTQEEDAATVDIDDASSAPDAELAVASDVDGATSGDSGAAGVQNGAGKALHDSYMGRYLGALQSYFIGRFYGACARLPEPDRDGKQATATIHVTGRQMTGFSAGSSGDGAFDGEVQGTLSSSQGLPLPAPPDPIADEIVDKTVVVNFSCTKASP